MRGKIVRTFDELWGAAVDGFVVLIGDRVHGEYGNIKAAKSDARKLRDVRKVPHVRIRAAKVRLG